MNSWMYLLLAGAFEVGFTTFMKLSEGFTIMLYTVGFVFCAIISFSLLNKSLIHIPLGTAYAVWTGIGALGTVVVGMVFFKDPISMMRGLFLVLLIGSIIGLKMVSES